MRPGRTSRLLVVGALVGAGGLALVPTTAQAAVGQALFTPYAVHALSSGARGVAFGDVTGDGRTDVVATTAGTLAVLAQAPDGTLAAPVEYALDLSPTSANALAVGIADLDSDGDQDVVVTTKDGVQLFDQLEDGTLAYDWSFLPPGARDLEVVDVSGDGLADLVVDTDAGIRVYWQIFGDLMSARPTAEVSTSNATEVEVGDVTGDGLPDIVSAVGSAVEVRAQLPDLSFAAPAAYPSGGLTGADRVNGLALGDTNGDGLLDVHVTTGSSATDSRVVTRYQTPNHVLGYARLTSVANLPQSLEAADLDGNGSDDLVVLHGGGQAGVVAEEPGALPTETLFPLPAARSYPVDGLAVGDVTGDGLADVAAADETNGLVLLRHAPAGTDVTPPFATITSGPSAGITTTSATFTFTATEPSTFACSLDDAAWQPCSSPVTYDGLAVGGHVFGVRATDAAGNVQVRPTYRQFAVVAPDTRIVSGPTGTVRSDAATFTFDSGTTSASSFECRLDGAAWGACTSPVSYTALGVGRDHVFEVRAKGSGGVVDPTPATRTWTVDTAADVAVTTTGPATVRKNATITWTTVVTNSGPGTATGVSLAQAVPSGVASAKATGCTGTTTLTCVVGSLAPGASRTFTVTGKVSAAKGTLSTTATVTSTSWDRTSGNDRATATSTVGK